MPQHKSGVRQGNKAPFATQGLPVQAGTPVPTNRGPVGAGLRPAAQPTTKANAVAQGTEQAKNPGRPNNI